MKQNKPINSTENNKIGRQLGPTTRIVVFFLGILCIPVTAMFYVVFGPSALALLAVSATLFYIGFTGSPRTWLTGFVGLEPEWDRNIVNGVSPEPKYRKFSWVEYALILSMFVVGLVSIPLFNILGIDNIFHVRGIDIGVIVFLSTAFNGYAWQTRYFGQVGFLGGFVMLILGEVIMLIGWLFGSINTIAYFIGYPFVGLMAMYSGLWSLLRSYLIRKFHINHKLASK